MWCLGVVAHTLMHVPMVQEKLGDIERTDLRVSPAIRNDDFGGRRDLLERLARRNAALLSLILYCCRIFGQRVGLALHLPWRLGWCACFTYPKK